MPSTNSASQGFLFVAAERRVKEGMFYKETASRKESQRPESIYFTGNCSRGSGINASETFWAFDFA